MSLISTKHSDWFDGLKEQIASARRGAIADVNVRMTQVYWMIGKEIGKRQPVDGEGAEVMESLAEALRHEFPEMTGLSSKNLRYMRKLANAWPDFGLLQQTAAKLPWGSNKLLLDKLRTGELRVWYARAAVANGWTNAVLRHQIDTRIHERLGRTINNFNSTIEAGQAEIANSLFKDPYVLDFVDAQLALKERDLERRLISEVQKLLLEFGKGFAFVGNQYHLSVNGDDFYIDILFYHIQLKRYVVVELKVVDFEPEFVGKMNFYLQAVDRLVAGPDDKPSIGLILCRGRNGLVVEYSLGSVSTPMAVSQYTVLPAELASVLPDEGYLEERLGIEDLTNEPLAAYDADRPTEGTALDDDDTRSRGMEP